MGNGHSPIPANELGGSIDIDEGTLARTGAPEPGPVGLDSKGGGSKQAHPTMADQIVSFARNRRGDRVGNGECFTLADRALRGAGARSAADFGEVVPEADYVWGTSINQSDLRPGDIIQMRDYHCDLEIRTEDGGGTDIVTREENRPHHTAIVEEVGSNGVVTVLEQNFPEGGPVTLSRLHLSSVTYSSGSRTTRAEVRGTFWFYRPQAR